MRTRTHGLGLLLAVALMSATSPCSAGAIDEFEISLEQTVSNGVPGPGAGNIEASGNIDRYTFTVAANTFVYFDEIVPASCNIRWACIAPNAAVLFTNQAMCNTDPGIINLAQAGEYTIEVTGFSGATGTYSFVLWEVNPVDEFEIDLKMTISDGVPGPGAGNIEEPGAMDRYTFDVGPGTTVFFEEVSGSCSIRWACIAPDASVVFSNHALCNNNPGSILLEDAGTYVIEVDSGLSAVTGTYSFVLWEVNPVDEFVIGLKQVVSDGVPGPGAGNIEEPGAMDRYSFVVDPGTLVYFDELSGACPIVWSCIGPDSTVLFSNNALCNNDPGSISLALGGTYTIEVHSENSSGTGTYSFTLWEVNPTDTFEIAIDQVVSAGVPGPGAGIIEEPGAMDAYTFVVDPGTQVYFDELSASNCNLDWRCRAPDGSILFNNNAMCVTDPGVITLEQTGTHVVEVYGAGGAIGNYSFRLLEVNPTETFPILLEQTVSEGAPAAGAGNIESPGSVDEYTFSVTPGTVVFFDELSSLCPLQWRCTAPNGATVFGLNTLCTTDPGVHVLDQPGTYTLRVSGPGGATGTYSFIVWHVNPPDEFIIDLDELVANGLPGAGAGNIEEPGASDRYTISIPAGIWVCFYEISGACAVQWSCVGPDSVELFEIENFCGTGPGRFFISAPGQYEITVNAAGDAVGSYSFKVRTSSTADTNQDCLVNVLDLLTIIGGWGPCANPQDCPADVTGDGTVNVSDLLLVIGHWD